MMVALSALFNLICGFSQADAESHQLSSIASNLACVVNELLLQCDVYAVGAASHKIASEVVIQNARKRSLQRPMVPATLVIVDRVSCFFFSS
jgi:hypothetical protein